jgi:hypothetical protein
LNELSRIAFANIRKIVRPKRQPQAVLDWSTGRGMGPPLKALGTTGGFLRGLKHRSSFTPSPRLKSKWLRFTESSFTASAHLGRWREADVAIVDRADPETLGRLDLMENPRVRAKIEKLAAQRDC